MLLMLEWIGKLLLVKGLRSREDDYSKGQIPSHDFISLSLFYDV
jgi:hypothetical protein